MRSSSSQQAANLVLNEANQRRIDKQNREVCSLLGISLEGLKLLHFEVACSYLDNRNLRKQDRSQFLNSPTFMLWLNTCIFVKNTVWCELLNASRDEQDYINFHVSKLKQFSYNDAVQTDIVCHVDTWFSHFIIEMLRQPGVAATDKSIMQSEAVPVVETASQEGYPIKNAQADIWYCFDQVIKNAMAEAKRIPDLDMTLSRAEIMLTLLRLTMTADFGNYDPRFYFDLTTLANAYINLERYKVTLGQAMLSLDQSAQHYYIVNLVVPGYYISEDDALPY